MSFKPKHFIAAAAAALGLAVLAQPAETNAQTDPDKWWYTIWTVTTNSGNCRTVNIAFTMAPNYSANYNASPPAGYVKGNSRTATRTTASQGGWCPKSMTAAACEKREKDRAAYVWNGNLRCGTVRWNSTTLISR